MSVKRCPQCNLVNWATEFLCKRCGQDLQVLDVLQPAKVEMSGTGFEKNPSPDPFQTQPNSPGNFPSFGDSNQQTFPSFNDNFPTEEKRIHSPQTDQQYYAYQNTGSQRQQKSGAKNGMAIASLVFGILGFPFVSMIIGGIISIFLAIIFGTAGAIFGMSVFLLMIPLSLILGIITVVRANKMPSVYGGKSLAITGIIFSSCGILMLPVFAIIGAIAVPNLLAAKKAANEGSAISGLRTISIAEDTYRSMTGRCADLQTLGAQNMIGPALAKGEKNGYRFIVVNLPTMNGDCAVTATPISASDGVRAFYFSSEDAVIRARQYDGKPAGPTDKPLEENEELVGKPF